MRMKFTFKSLLLAVSLLVGSVNAWAEEQTLYPEADLYLDWENGDENYGSATVLHCGIWEEYWDNATPGLRQTNNSYKKMAVLKFNVSDYLGKITSATLKVTGTNATTRNQPRSIYLGYFDKTEWDENEATKNSIGLNERSATDLNIHPFGISQSIAANQTTEVSFSNDAFLSYLNADEDGIVSLIIYSVAEEITINSRESETGKPQLVITYVNETLYTANFIESNGLSPIITIYSDKERNTVVSNGTLTAGNTYYYTASLIGYNDYEGQFTVESTNPTVSFTMIEKSTYSYVVNAKVGEDVLQVIASGSVYDDENPKIGISKYIKVDGVWYVTNETSFVVTLTKENNSKDVVYEKSDIYYFVEAENLTSTTSTYGGFISNDANDVSGGREVRHIGNSYWYTEPIEDAGVYTVSFPARYGSSKSASTIDLKLRDAQGGLTDLGIIVTLNEENSKNLYSYNITIPAGSSFVLNKGEGNSNYYIDYITFARIDNVSVTISPAGYSTFSSEYAVEIPEGLTAYIATATNVGDDHKGTITLEEVSGAVAANTGLLLKGDAEQEYKLPVSAEGTSYDGDNLLKPTAANGQVAAGNYIFAFETNDPSTYGFYYLEGATGVGAGKAYLEPKGDISEIKTFSFVFGNGTATAVEAVEAVDADAEGAIYNVAGQQVGKDYKGIVIKNGKKYLNK